MRRTSLLIALFCIFILAFLYSCKKADNPGDELLQFKVLEYNTDTPVGGAKVDAYKCVLKDWLGNCLNMGSFLGTTSSNNDGKASFSKSLDVGALKVKKDKYWETEINNPGFSTVFSLTPIATLKVRIIRVNQYPAGYVLNLTGQPQGCYDCIWETRQLIQPADTIVYLKGGGYYNNSVGWFVTPGGPGTGNSTQAVMVNRFDTAQFEIRY